MWHLARFRSATQLITSLMGALVIVFLGAPFAVAMEVKWPHSPTLYVRCDPESVKTPHKVEVSGPIMISRNGPYRAWVEVTSTPKPRECFNVTKLWIKQQQREPFLAFTDAPTDPYLSGTGMNLVDWSADGELLLTELWNWNTQPNDAGVGRSILVFEPANAAKYEINLSWLFADQKDKDCDLRFELLGFTAQRWVALKAEVSTFYEPGEEEKPAEKMCKEKSQVWAVDPITQRWEVLPEDFQAEHNSLIEKRAVRNVRP